MKNGHTRKIAGSEQREFLKQLRAAVAEKDVEASYKGIFQRHYQTTFPSPYDSDGYIEPEQQSILGDNLRLLLEVKFGLDLTRGNERAKIIAQCIYYLKRFELDGRSLPNVIMGGDENQMFTIYAPKLHTYLEHDYDWSIAPSNAWRLNEPLYRDLINDPNLNVYVFDLETPGFDINEVFRSIDILASQKGEFNKLRVTEANLRIVFDEFTRLVFDSKDWLNDVKKIGAANAVSIFITSILGNPDVYIVPTKKNILHLTNGKEIQINARNYDAFFSRFDRKYSSHEVDAITAIADQLIEELNRRFHGDFWTPTIWANRAIEMMDNDLGQDWREKYVVWDPAAGTKNLTRDYNFKKLYSSTIHQSEIDMSRQYNHSAETFQYDFLNDDIDISPASDPRDLKMPPSLFQALKADQPIVFYTNPPYGQATNAGATGTHKAGIAKTKIGQEMKDLKMGLASAELYTQFIYRVQKLARDFNLSNVFFFFFNKGFLVSPTFEHFVDELLEQFEFKGGFMLNAGEFQGTSSNWGIVFSNFHRKTVPAATQTSFQFQIEQTGLDGIEVINSHVLERVGAKDTISQWLREIKLPKQEYNGGKYPQMSSAFSASSGHSPRGRLCVGAFGYMVNNADSVQESERTVSIQSTSAYRANGTPVTADNLARACVTFAVRKSILPDASWVNDKDIFRRPSDDFQASSQWQEFVNDCIVYSLFHRSSYQTSLRDFEYKGELYDVKNEWFFMSKAEITKLAEQHQLNDIVYDLRSSNERHMYEILKNTALSVEAANLLGAGKNLVSKTFAKRYIASQEHPEWHLMTWDAGYYQAYKITTLFKEEYSEIMADFNKIRNTLEAKIRAKVYADDILSK